MKTSALKHTVIIGAGPTGLGAALALEKAGAPWILLEKNSYFGGLAASFKQDGFQWDIGGHVIFSHYREYDHLLDNVIPEERWLIHKRTAFVKVCGRLVPYPFQYNLGFLPEKVSRECTRSLLALAASNVRPDDTNFLRYIETHFGEAISRVFMVPYNEKIWAHPLDQLSTQWLGDRIPMLDVKRATQGGIDGDDNQNWGPNSTFRFPLIGGTGEIWRCLAKMLPDKKINLNTEVIKITTSNRTITIKNGDTIEYDNLINTMPVDLFVSLSDMFDVVPLTRYLVHTSTCVVGIGMRSLFPVWLKNFSWIYFPERDIPFYRATIFSNYSPLNARPGHWSVMLEVSESQHKRIDPDTILNDCIMGCINAGLIQESNEVIHTWVHRAEYGYPVPVLERDIALKQILLVLEERGIFSRGRFGGWKYEVGNMDHSFMQGIEAANRILTGSEEITIWHPERVNNSKSI